MPTKATKPAKKPFKEPLRPVMPLYRAMEQSTKLRVKVMMKSEFGKLRITGVYMNTNESHSKLITYGPYLEKRMSEAVVENYHNLLGI